EAAPPAVDVPRVENAMAGADGASPLDFDEIYEDYRSEVETVRPRRTGSSLTVAYTPIHGVGWRVFERLAIDAGYHNAHVVDEQRDPAGDFPTANFPNPEEPGAMDLVMELGDRIEADLAIANDPDADRLAVAIPSSEGWRLLTGTPPGVLLAEWLRERWTGAGVRRGISSSVSSPTLAAGAGLTGARFGPPPPGGTAIAGAALDL